jgi:hypothetical protein
MSYKINYKYNKKPQRPKTGQVEFYYYISGEGNRCQAILTPNHYEKGTIEYLGRKGKFDHFLCCFPGEVPTLFIGKIY